MLLAFEATVKGLWRALVSVRSVFFLYLANLALSACVVVPIYALFNARLAASPEARALFARHDSVFTADFLRVNAEAFSALGESAAVVAVIWFLIWLFLEGGALATLADPARRLPLTGFFAACGRNFFPFLRGLIPAGIAVFLLMLLNEQAGRFLTWWFEEFRGGSAGVELLGFALAGKAILFLALFVLLVLLPTEFARVRCVVDDERGMIRGYWKGLTLCLSRPFTVIGFFLLSSALFAAVIAGVLWIVDRIPLDRQLRPLHDLGWKWDPSISPIGLQITVSQLAMWLVVTMLVQRAAGMITIWRASTSSPAKTAGHDPELVYSRGPVVDLPASRSARYGLHGDGRRSDATNGGR